MSAPIFIADEEALRAYLERFARELMERVVGATRDVRDPDETMSVREAARLYSDGSELDLVRWIDRFNTAISDGRLRTTVPRAEAPAQGDRRRCRRPRRVRLGDLIDIWERPRR